MDSIYFSRLGNKWLYSDRFAGRKHHSDKLVEEGKRPEGSICSTSMESMDLLVVSLKLLELKLIS